MCFEYSTWIHIYCLNLYILNKDLCRYTKRHYYATNKSYSSWQYNSKTSFLTSSCFRSKNWTAHNVRVFETKQTTMSFKWYQIRKKSTFLRKNANISMLLSYIWCCHLSQLTRQSALPELISLWEITFHTEGATNRSESGFGVQWCTLQPRACQRCYVTHLVLLARQNWQCNVQQCLKHN